MSSRDEDNTHLQILNLGDDFDLMPPSLIQDTPDEVDIGGSLQHMGSSLI